MRPYLISLIVGVAVGVVYGLIKVRSPAPPAIALLGLLGMLAGEQFVPVVRSYLSNGEAPSRAASVAQADRTTVEADRLRREGSKAPHGQ